MAYAFQDLLGGAGGADPSQLMVLSQTDPSFPGQWANLQATMNSYNQTQQRTVNPSISPEANMAANNGTMTGGQTTQQLPQNMVTGAPVATQQLVPPANTANPVTPGATIANAMAIPNMNQTPLQGVPSTSMQLGGASSNVTRDTMGSKLVEALQGAKSTQMNEVANRLSALGISGGQAGSALGKANRDYMLGMSQGLGNFNIDRLNQAANINRDFLQLELAQQLGLGNLELGSRQLDSQIALRLAEMAQYADTQTRAELANLLQQYFGGTV